MAKTDQEAAGHAVASDHGAGSDDAQQTSATNQRVEGSSESTDGQSHMNLKSFPFVMIVVALALSVFCVALDNIIIATAIPRITDDFRSTSDIGWYGSGYLLPTCAFQLLSGKLYSRYSAKWIFMGALFLFEVGSLITAVAPSSATFIAGRAIAGTGAAALFTGSLVIIATIVPPAKAPAFQSLNAAVFGIASAVGPLIGGAFTDSVTWRWCFYINLPIGGVSAVFVIFFLKIKSPPRYDSASLGRIIWNMDLLGLVFFLPSIVCFLLAMQWGDVLYDWSSWRSIVVLVFFAVLFVAFLVDQYLMGDNATIPPRLARQRTLAAVCWFNIFLFGAFNTTFYFLPLYFQGVKGTSAEASGIRMIPLVVIQVIAIIFTGIASAQLGHYVSFFIASSVVATVGVGLITTWQIDSSTGIWVGYQILTGVGFGLGMQMFATAIPAVLPEQDVATGLALATMGQFFGASIFLAIGNNVFDTQLIKMVDAMHIPGWTGREVVAIGATGFQDVIPTDYLPGVTEAYMKALRWTFRMSLILSAVSIFGAVGMEWKSLKGRPKQEEVEEKRSSGELSTDRRGPPSDLA